MEIQEMLNLAIVGGLVSWFLEFVTNNIDSQTSKMITLVASAVVGSLYWFISQTGLWESILGVLVSASTIYAFVIKG